MKQKSANCQPESAKASSVGGIISIKAYHRYAAGCFLFFCASLLLINFLPKNAAVVSSSTTQWGVCVVMICAKSRLPPPDYHTNSTNRTQQRKFRIHTQPHSHRHKNTHTVIQADDSQCCSVKFTQLSLQCSSHRTTPAISRQHKSHCYSSIAFPLPPIHGS